MNRSKCLLLSAVPETVGRSRAFVRRVLRMWRVDSDTAELLVSELVTNALNATVGGRSVYGGDSAVTPIYLCLSLNDTTVLIEVWDGSPEPPRVRDAAEDDEHGRGLLLVDALAKEWGHQVLPEGGKIVWCEVDRCVTGA